MELETDFDVMSSEEVIPDSEDEKEEVFPDSEDEKEKVVEVVTGVGRKRRRRARELSGHQMALKKLEREGKAEYWHCHFPPPFGEAVVTLCRVLMEFADGSEDKISTETASAMRIYFCRKLGFTVSVSLPF